MGLGLAWYLGSLVAAFVWLLDSTLAPKLTLAELAFAAIPVGTIGGAWLVFLVACALSQLTPLTLGISSIFAAVVLAGASMRLPANMRAAVGRWRGRARGDSAVAVAVAAAVSYVMWPLYSSRMIPEANGMILSGGSCYGDLPIHMYLAESFLRGCNTDISWSGLLSPMFAGERMTYPFLPDFHAAAVKAAGDTLRVGFLAPGFAMTVAMWGLLVLFTLRVTGSRLGGALAVALTIGAGGLGGIRWVMRDGWRAAAYQDVVQHDPTGEWKHLWFAFVPHILLPQRGATFAYPMAVLVLLLVWVGTAATAGVPPALRLTVPERRAFLVYAALFTGSLPLVQAHAFIGLGVIIGTFFVLDAHKWGADVDTAIAWATAGVVALATGGPQMALFRKTVEQGAYGKFLSYGWLFNNYEFGEPHGSPVGFFRFWWHSLGPALHLFCVVSVAYLIEAVFAYRLGITLRHAHGVGAVDTFLAGIGAGDLVSGASDGKREPPLRSKATAAAAAAAAAVAASHHARRDDDDANAEESGGMGPSPSHGRGAATPTLLSAFLTEAYSKWLVPQWAYLGRALRLAELDAAIAPANALTLNGRALDTAKLALGAFLVFLLGNYVNFQPWDRDNAKLYYIWVFVAAAINGAALAAPIEALALASRSAAARFAQWTGTDQAAALTLARSSGGAAASQRPKVPSSAGVAALPPRFTMRSLALVVLCAVASPVLVGLCTASGFMLLAQESRHTGVMLDRDAIETGEWIAANTPKKAVFVHNNYHIEPSGSIAARPTLVAYYGWVSNHGYNRCVRRSVQLRQRVLSAEKRAGPAGISTSRRRIFTHQM